MHRKCFWVLSFLLIGASISACKSVTTAFPINTPTLTRATETALPSTTTSMPATPTFAIRTTDVTNTPEQEILASISDLVVVYPKNDDLWVWFAGVARQLTRNRSVSGFKLSADGGKVAFTRKDDNGTYELWVIDIDGSDEHLLVSPTDMEDLGKTSETDEVGQSESTLGLSPYAWVPGTSTIAFGTYRSIKYDGTIYHYDLNLVNAETGEITTLLPPGTGGKFVYSPDGSKIAVFTQREISIVDADGTNQKDKLMEFQTPTYGEAQIFPDPVWAADGQYLLLGLPPDDPSRIQSLPTTLWKITVDGTPAIRLGATRFPIMPGGYNVSFSPDLKLLAYTAEGSGLSGTRYEIHIASFDGSDDKVVQVAGMLYFWNWSPDGQRFIYYSHPDPDAWYISDLAGNATQMNFLPVDVDLEWVNNEAFLYYVRCGDQDCDYELRLTTLDGETVVIDRSRGYPSFDFSYR